MLKQFIIEIKYSNKLIENYLDILNRIFIIIAILS